MKRILCNVFEGPRAYFTDFDERIVQFKRNREGYKREVERRLKVLLLTKNTIVCAAAHLASPFVYELFKTNPVLLTKEMVIPALREDKNSLSDLVAERKLPQILKQQMADFYDGEVRKVVTWELVDNTAWFKKNFVKELKNVKSVIRRNIVTLSEEELNDLIMKIENQRILTREFVLKSISELPSEEKKVLRNFANLVYHMSGARVVNCESALPQENYIDYSLADISNRKIILSEVQIFWKIFLEFTFEATLTSALPIELLDILSFEDIYWLRKPISKSSFNKKYDSLIQKSVQVIEESHPNDFLFDMGELLQIRENISKDIAEILEKELREILKKKHIESVKELRKSALSVGIGLAGFIPGVSTVTNLVGVLSSSPELFVNVGQALTSKRQVNSYELYLKNKKEAIRKMIEKSSFSDKAEFLEMVNLLTNTIISKMRL